MTTAQAGIDFKLPDELSAHEPPEARGLSRDAVRLMVSHVGADEITHTRFSRLPDFLRRGDVLVLNTSATINASFDAFHVSNAGRSTQVSLHLSTPLSATRWVVELRRRSEKGTSPLLDGESGDEVRLAGGGTARLIEPYLRDQFASGNVRLWIAELSLPDDALTYATKHGSPIRYSYVPKPWPLSSYQTVFATEPGSAEMPSAGRAFTYGMLERLSRRGVLLAPLILHTGVSSLESDEPPYPERYRVPPDTARTVNGARANGGRVVAVGTTAVRAIETVTMEDGSVHAGSGWTDLVITPERGLRVVDSILTGFHAPHASHLSMLQALVNRDHLSLAYESALAHRYLWHEFGDMHLILS